MNCTMDEQITNSFLLIVDKLYNVEPAGEPFRFPVDPEKYQCWDYYVYVKHPIDLTTIRNKLTAGHYKDAWRCVTDLNLMFTNAYIFNKKGTPVYEWATKLNKIWNNELTNVMPRLSYCCGVLHKFGPQLLFCHGTTPDRYCQISIGAKYKCYKDSFSFCMPCFNKIETKTVNLEVLSCETTRLNPPREPVKKSDFDDCTNDKWQYERFIQCSECQRRIHQICDLYPADEDEIEQCLQHEEIEEEQKALCKIPERFLQAKPHGVTIPKQEITKVEMKSPDISREEIEASTPLLDDSRQKLSELQPTKQQYVNNFMSFNDANEKRPADSRVATQHTTNQDGISGPVINQSQSSLDDELVLLAQVAADDMNSFNPSSPNPDENVIRFDSAKETRLKDVASFSSDLACSRKIPKADLSHPTNGTPSATKNSVDDIAARLSNNKVLENQAEEILTPEEVRPKKRDKYVCNHCYKKDQYGFNMRHRKFSARRLPHTRMSRYIETKVNEYIRQNSPTAGEMTIRVLAAYRDTLDVKPEMREYIKHCRTKDPSQHANLEEYPEKFEFTTRAIFAWQEIDGIDVCVFGMHVQEYGDDCPEPNKKVVYLSYLDSVHFFRPKQFRTAVYHEILLSYFKYVKKLGFRRVFIWVCPSRKGDDYIFYRHPTEQKMPTLKRLSDWYVHLLDKGCSSGIIERYQNIYDYAISESVASALTIPYLSGDYWPGEFERLLKLMIESQKIYDEKMSQTLSTNDEQDRDNFASLHNISGLNSSFTNNFMHSQLNKSFGQNNLPSPGPFSLTSTPAHSSKGDDLFSLNGDDSRYLGSPMKLEEQPLDLSKTNSTESPESCFEDELFEMVNAKKRRRKPSMTLGYTKKRSRMSQSRLKSGYLNSEGSKYGASQKSGRKSGSIADKNPSAAEIMESPDQELIKNLERSFKRQKDGFMVVHLRECDCLPYYESQRRKEEVYSTCDLMLGREPFLHLARQMNYEFSTLRRAKFSSLAMVKHLGKYLGLNPICKSCYSFDSSKRYYSCSLCEDFYLCTSCEETTNHEHSILMQRVQTMTLPDISEFLQECAPSPVTNSISSASSTISNKSYNESNIDPTNPMTGIDIPNIERSVPLHRHLSNTIGPTPLTCKKQRNRGSSFSANRAEDEENAKVNPFISDAKAGLERSVASQPSQSTASLDVVGVDFDRLLITDFMRQAQASFDVDFDKMKGESKQMLSHYWACANKDSCERCKFVVLSCSFMIAMLRSPRFRMITGGSQDSSLPSRPGVSTNLNPIPADGVNLTKSDRPYGKD